jgi:hypothetical protein
MPKLFSIEPKSDKAALQAAEHLKRKRSEIEPHKGPCTRKCKTCQKRRDKARQDWEKEKDRLDDLNTWRLERMAVQYNIPLLNDFMMEDFSEGEWEAFEKVLQELSLARAAGGSKQTAASPSDKEWSPLRPRGEFS